MALEHASAHESPIYHRFSGVYEGLFSLFFGPRARAMIRRLEIPAGARVLEVGVGTGLALEAYPQEAHVTGIDLSGSMLAKARSKVHQHGWRHIQLLRMDATDMQLQSQTFDYVTAFHVVSVVPDADKLLDEMVRVCKPGGTLLIINHLRSPRRWLARIIDRLGPLTERLGWRTDLALEDIAGTPDLELVRAFKTTPWSLFTVIIARRKMQPGDEGESGDSM